MEENKKDRREYHRMYNASERGKERNRKYCASEKYKEYNKIWNLNNKDKNLARGRKYSKTPKGIANSLKKKDRKKFGEADPSLNHKLILMLIERDKNCVYCGSLLKDEVEYDHLNPFLPFSKINSVRCCLSCNRSKLNANVLDWLKFKKLEPNKLILEMLNAQTIKDSQNR